MLGAYLYKNPKKFSGVWNFGTEKNTVTSVLTIVKYAIKLGIWSIKYKKAKKFYEQTNLQLNIEKVKEF